MFAPRLVLSSIALTLGAWCVPAQGGGPPPMFALVDRVLINATPHQGARIQIWGTFVRTPGPGAAPFQAPEVGYLHLAAPAEGDFRREWDQWQSAAGTGRIVSIGTCYDAGAFQQYSIHPVEQPVGEPDGEYEVGQLGLTGSPFLPETMLNWEVIAEPLRALQQAAATRVAQATNVDALVVHEWGTFTTFAGSDGVHLDFRPFATDEPDLPAFVANRSNASAGLFSKKLMSTRVRMETPVLFFYPSRECDVHVAVDFPQGLITEFYPPVKEIQPPFDSKLATTTGETIGKSRIDWGTVHLIPPHNLEPQVEHAQAHRAISQQIHQALLQPAHEFPHYAEARQTDAALIHWRGDDVLSSDHFEKFLFYRGVGNFTLPMRVEAIADGTVQVTNDDAQPIRGLFLIDVAADGKTIRMATLPSIDGHTTEKLAKPAVVSRDEVMSSVQRALIAEGLYTTEATAMLQSWQASWFAEPGTRVFYLVPTAWTDTLLPLQIEPAPNKIVRVLVARCELLTPSVEGHLLQAMAARAAARHAARTPAKVNLPIPPALFQLGRMAEPALTRLQRMTKEPEVRAEIARVREQLASTSP